MLDTRKQEKKYLNGIYIREHVFDNGGNILKVTFTQDFIDQLKQEMQESGEDNVRAVIARKKETTDTGISHYSYIDTWRPKKDFNDTNDPQWDNKKSDEEDLPF